MRIRRSVIVLTDVIMTFKIMPKDPSVDLDGMETEIKSKLNVTSIDREPVAFGLNSLKVVANVPETDGAADKAEDDLNAIEGVGGVEVISMTRDM